MENLSNLKIIKFKYALKKFTLYFLYGAVCSLFPFSFGVVFGSPAIFLGAVALATADTINLEINENKKALIVFSKPHKVALYVLIIIMVIYLTISGQLAWLASTK